MSYPDPRYFGEHGETSATFRPATAAPDFVSKPRPTDGPHISQGTAYHYLSTTISTGGEYGLYRVDMGPEASGPSTHFHSHAHALRPRRAPRGVLRRGHRTGRPQRGRARGVLPPPRQLLRLTLVGQRHRLPSRAAPRAGRHQRGSVPQPNWRPPWPSKAIGHGPRTPRTTSLKPTSPPSNSRPAAPSRSPRRCGMGSPPFDQPAIPSIRKRSP
jgi:hypothetical protein